MSTTFRFAAATPNGILLGTALTNLYDISEITSETIAHPEGVLTNFQGYALYPNNTAGRLQTAFFTQNTHTWSFSTTSTEIVSLLNKSRTLGGHFSISVYGGDAITAGTITSLSVEHTGGRGLMRLSLSWVNGAMI